MAIRKILVPIDGGEATRTALETALAVGRLHGAHVEALHVRLSPSDTLPLVGEGMSGALIEEMIELTQRESETRQVAARQIFTEARTRLEVPLADSPTDYDVSTAMIEVVGREDEETAARGRLADLIVVGRPTAGADVTSNLTLNAALFETGRPILVAPAEPRPVLGRRIAVCWNNSIEAARALAASLPFLAHAEQVWVVTADSSTNEEDTCAPVVDYLAWHGVAAEKRVVLGRRSVSDALLDGCADADLAIMGAYTHSRLLELILGGVTRHMLEESTLPLLMAH